MVAGPTLRGQNFLWINENVDYPLIWHLERHSDNNSRENPFTACILGGQFQVAVRAVLVALSLLLNPAPWDFSLCRNISWYSLIGCRLISFVYTGRLFI